MNNEQKTNDKGQIRVIIVMGVAGSGKTTIGQELARTLGGVFQDGDDFHPPANLVKMSRGEPLNDEDRKPWLERIGNAIARWQEDDKPYILACSALKQDYRDFLSHQSSNVKFVYLKGLRDLIKQRLITRENHFMPPSLLDSQLEILEEPRAALIIDITPTPKEIVAEIIRQLNLRVNESSF